MIPFNRAPVVASTQAYIADALQTKVSGDGKYTKLCTDWLVQSSRVPHALLTTSCSHALDMAAALTDIGEGDEVIMPSFTFSSTANAFAGRKARLVFIDIRPDTMNMDEKLIEAAVTDRTRAIVPVHYAGVACEMDVVMQIARKYNLTVVEDAAQGVMSSYKGRPLGSVGHMGCFSFHETKNYSMGEGGALLLQDRDTLERAEIMREKGTDRGRFFRGQVDKYRWQDWGSSYLPSEINAAYLWSQLEMAEEMNSERLARWRQYYDGLLPLRQRGRAELPTVPNGCVHNAHMFYIKAHDLQERGRLTEYLKSREILSVYHYVPLHSAPAGLKYGRFAGEDVYTTKESERLLRLPLFYGLSEAEAERTVRAVLAFYGK